MLYFGLFYSFFPLVLNVIPANARSLITALYPPQREDARSVYLYGYINNEHYKHYLPGTRIISTGKRIVLICPPGSSVEATRASFGSPVVKSNGEWRQGQCHFTTSLAWVRSKCRNQTICKLTVQPDLFAHEETPSGCTDAENFTLAADYRCIPIKDPPPLYSHQGGFVQGVTPHFLLLYNHTAPCAAGRELQLQQPEKSRYTLAEAVDECREDRSCTFVVWNEEAGRPTALCTDEAWKEATKEEAVITAVNPSEFLVSGYAVYLNYLGICMEEDILMKTADINNIKEGVVLCNGTANCSYASLSLAPGLLSLPGFRDYLWLCSGVPVMIPMDGAIFAAKTTQREKPESIQTEVYPPSHPEDSRPRHQTSKRNSSSSFKY